MLKRLIVYISLFLSFGIFLYSYKSDRIEMKSEGKKEPRTKVQSNFLSASAATVYKSKKNEPNVIINQYCRDISMYIAGKKLNQDSELFSFTNDSLWIKYQSDLAKVWDSFYHNKIEYVGQWSKEKLNNVNDQAKTVLYPFSGPDFLYLYKFLPDADTYYLFGLERIGSIPDINKIKGDALPKYLQSLNKSIATFIDASYFITQYMSSDLNNMKIDGVLPLILFFMAKSEVTVTDVRPAMVDSDGTITTQIIKEQNMHKAKFGKGVEISFLSPIGKPQKLYYFSGDLQNKCFSEKNKIHKMLSKIQGNVATLFKSASYLMHANIFSTLRKLVLTKSNFIIQDDSGIPYNIYAKGGWDMCFFGEYTLPISSFKNYVQNDLKKAFPQYAEKLDFRFGYNKTSYILVSTKINPEKAVLLPKGLPSNR